MRKGKNPMKKLEVEYSRGGKRYAFLYDEDRMRFEVGKKYYITTDREYDNPITVINIGPINHLDIYLKVIQKAEPVDRRDSVSVSLKQTKYLTIENVYFNEEKRTTVVVWSDGIKTKLKCAPDDIFDKEKGIALAFMKRFYGNGGKFNDILKKYT